MTRTEPRHPRRAVAARGRGVPPRLRRRQPARRRDAAALRQRARRRHRHAVHRARCGCRSCPRSSASTPACSSSQEDDVIGALDVRDGNRGPGHLQRRRRRQDAVERGVAIFGKRRVPLPPSFTELAAAPLRLLRHRGPPARGARPAALRARRRQPPAQAGGLPLPVHDRGARWRASPRPAACASTVGDGRPVVPLRARGRELLPPLARGRAATRQS